MGSIIAGECIENIAGDGLQSESNLELNCRGGMVKVAMSMTRVWPNN
jgi:hypothetical protein